MKNILVCLTLLLLAGCIPVGDFGSYWAKGTVDRNLLGRWQEICDTQDKHCSSSAVSVTDNHGTYRIDSLDPQERGKKGYMPVEGRTLDAGKYAFLMAKDDNKKTGDLVRYEIRGDAFFEYTLDPKQTAAWLKRHYPHAKNISRPPCKGKCWSDEVRIEKLDAEVYKILGEIPDTKQYWLPAGKYHRQSGLNN